MRKWSGGIVALTGAVLVAVVGLLLLGASKRSDELQSLGVAPEQSVADLRGGQEVCQGPIGLAGRIDAVRFNPGSETQPAPPVRVVVRRFSDDRVLAQGGVPAGFDVAKPQTVRLGPLRAEQRVRLCFRNDARDGTRLAIFGDQPVVPAGCSQADRVETAVECRPRQVRPTVSTSAASIGGDEPLRGDVAAVLLRDRPVSLLARIPAMLDRASLFRPGFMNPAVWWSLLAAWVLLAPGLLAYALRTAYRP